MALTNEEWANKSSEFVARKNEIVSRLEAITLDDAGKAELANIIASYNQLQLDFDSTIDTLSESKKNKKEIMEEMKGKLTEVNTLVGVTDENLNNSTTANKERAISAIYGSNLSDEEKIKYMNDIDNIQLKYNENIKLGNDIRDGFDSVKADINLISNTVIDSRSAIKSKFDELKSNNVNMDSIKLEELDKDLDERLKKYSDPNVRYDEDEPQKNSDLSPNDNIIEGSFKDYEAWSNKYYIIERRLQAAETGLNRVFSKYNVDIRNGTSAEKYDMVMLSLNTPEEKAKFKKEFREAIEKDGLNLKEIAHDFNIITKNMQIILDNVKNELIKLSTELEQKRVELEKEKKEVEDLETQKLELENELENINNEISILEKEIEEDEKAGKDPDSLKAKKLVELKGKKSELENKIETKKTEIESKTKNINEKETKINDMIEKVKETSNELIKRSNEFNERCEKTKRILKSKGIDVNTIEVDEEEVKPKSSDTRAGQAQSGQAQSGQTSRVVQAPGTSTLTLEQQSMQPAVKQASRNLINFNYIIGYLGENERMTKTDAMNRFKCEEGGKEFDKLHRAFQELNASIIKPTIDERNYLSKYMKEERNFLDLTTSDSDYSKKFTELVSVVGVKLGKQGEKFCDLCFGSTNENSGILAGFNGMKENELEKWQEIITAYGNKKGEMTEEQIVDFEKYIMTPTKFGLLNVESKKLCKSSLSRTFSKPRDWWYKKSAEINPDGNKASVLRGKEIIDKMPKSILKIENPEIASKGFRESLRDEVYPPNHTPTREEEKNKEKTPPGRE